MAAPGATGAKPTSEGHEYDHKHHEHWHVGETERESKCYKLFDFGVLETWKKAKKELCMPGSDPDDSALTCRVMRHPRLNAPTAPHTICDGRNVILDPKKLTPAKCCRHRPNYMCDGGATYHHYQHGAFKARCALSGGRLDLNNFPADHLKDIFDSFNAVDAWEQKPAADEARGLLTRADTPVTMMVTREKGEHVNMYHTLTDWYMGWQTLKALSIDPKTVQVVLLDAHPAGPLDSFWDHVLSRGKPMRRVAQLEKPMLMRRPVWSPPGYTNILLGKNWDDCRKPMRMMEAFVAAVDDAYDAPHSRSVDVIKILFISRKPYEKDWVDHKFIGRQISNEDAVLGAIRAVPGVEVRVVDFAHVKLDEQIRMAGSSDVLIGMHGAGLAHCLWLPAWGAVVEMGSRARLGVFFDKIAHWAGIQFENWINQNPNNFRKDSKGDYTKVDIMSLMPYVKRAVDNTRSRKRKIFSGESGG